MSDVAARRAAGDGTDEVTFAIGNINPGTVRCEYMQSVIGVIQHPRHEHPDGQTTRFAELLVKVHGPYLDVGRNYVVEKFMGTDLDVLLFVDSDEEFLPEQAHEIVAKVSPQRPVIGGYYVNHFAEFGVRPVALNWNMDGKAAQMFPIDLLGPDDGLVQVDCVGTGFMAIHRSLLEQMSSTFDAPCPWFAEVALGGSQMGEDVTFCQRAIALGHPVFVDAEVQVAHHKPIRFHPADLPAAQQETTNNA